MPNMSLMYFQDEFSNEKGETLLFQYNLLVYTTITQSMNTAVRHRVVVISAMEETQKFTSKTY